MSKEFQQPTKDYGDYGHKPNEYPETAFLRARQEHDMRMGTLYLMSRQWRIFSYLLLIALAIALGWNWYWSTKSNVIAYVVRVDQDIDTTVTKQDDITFKPNEKEMKYFLSQFVNWTRSLPDDSVVIKQNWKTAYRFLNSKGKTLLNHWIEVNGSPLTRMKEENVIVDISNISRLSDNTYQAQWKEQHFTKAGEVKEVQEWVGNFTVIIIQPKTEEEIFVNPLGLTISDFSWSKRIDSPKK